MSAEQIILARAAAELGPEPYGVAIQAGRHGLRADEPRAQGGGDTGPAPFELLLSSLAACTLITLSMYARRKGWPIAVLKVELKFLKGAEAGVIDRVVTLEGPDEAARVRLADVAERTPVTLALKAGTAIRTRFSA